MNPFQNPYLKGDLVLPELASSYLDRGRVRPGMIEPDGPVVRAFAAIGWEWGGAWRTLKDYQHFSQNGTLSSPKGLVRRAREELVGPMGERSSGRATSHDLEVSSPEQMRNVVLVGPSQSGKTTLVEALLVASGAINRGGSVAEHTTVCDFEDGERAHERSSSLAVAPVVHGGCKINLLDTPGYADFVGEVRAGLRAADCALFVWPPTSRRRGHPAAVARVRRGRDAPSGGGHQARPRPRRLRRRRCGRPGTRSASGCCRSSYPTAPGSPGCWAAPTTTSGAGR